MFAIYISPRWGFKTYYSLLIRLGSEQRGLWVGQDAPPTMGVGPEHVLLRPMNPRLVGIKKRATTA